MRTAPRYLFRGQRPSGPRLLASERSLRNRLRATFAASSMPSAPNVLSNEGMSWTRALSASEIRDRGRALFRHGKHQIVLFSTGDAVHAIDNRCPHEGYPRIQGSLETKPCSDIR
ncbi:MAG TPA: Rieske 2Fe-2S domain-containing protein [Vicinamibacteria bacterium]|nr:Rieske 2Fe-2S domain-containing protein [Vicinamibacteria bacterium]